MQMILGPSLTLMLIKESKKSWKAKWLLASQHKADEIDAKLRAKPDNGETTQIDQNKDAVATLTKMINMQELK